MVCIERRRRSTGSRCRLINLPTSPALFGVRAFFSGREQVDQGTRAVVEANVARTRLYKSLLAEAESHYSAVQSFKNLSTKAREQAEDHVKSAEKKAAKIMALFVI